ncbi:MAG: hypothetical protein GXO82_01215 [Chlorobi bacterium]|nr:hypothetical protein [Chlorobiota bacterium]
MGVPFVVEALMRIGVIDIGTNTMLLLIAECRDNTVAGIEHAYRVTRLGRGVDAHRRIEEQTFRTCLQTIVGFWHSMKRYNCDRMIITGTSALREVTNRDEFIASVKSQTGLEVEVLSGEEEARWTFAGGLSSMPIDGLYAVLDIGGGSTELAIGTHVDLQRYASIDAGAVRITERFFRHDPPTPEELAKARTFILQGLEYFPVIDPLKTTVIGVAGTVTTLAALDRNLKTYIPDQVTGHVLSRNFVEKTFHRFSSIPVQEIRELLTVEPGRSDVITGGILILLTFMEHQNIESIVASDRGLRYGIAMRECARINGVNAISLPRVP